MLYREFLQGVPARDNDHNHGVYETIEALYMLHPTMSKEEAYTLARPCVDNELSIDMRRVAEYISDELNRIGAELDENMASVNEAIARGDYTEAQSLNMDGAIIRGKRAALQVLHYDVIRGLI